MLAQNRLEWDWVKNTFARCGPEAYSMSKRKGDQIQ